MKNIKLYILFGLLAIWFKGAAQEAEAWASLDTNALTIGDQTALELGIKIPQNFVVQWPVIHDTVTSHIEVVKKSGIDTTFEQQQMVLKQKLIVTSFDSGYFEVPRFIFRFHPKGDTTGYRALTNTLFLQVYTPDVDTTKPFKAIKGPVKEPYTLAEILPWVGGGLVVVAGIVFLVIWLMKRKKNQPLFKAKPKPLLPPDVEAINKLEELRLARMWQSGKVKEYHSQLTDIMRNYLERRFGFDAPEMTTDEIMEALENHPVNEQVKEKLHTAFGLADLVKFAKAQPTPLENDLSLDHCVDFVKETKPVVTTSQEKDKEKEVNSEQKEER